VACLVKGTLLISGTQDASDATIETLHAIEHKMARTAEILVDVCAFAGTGNVLKVQQMLQICGEHAEKKKPAEPEPTETAAPDATATVEGEDVNMEGGDATAAGSSTMPGSLDAPVPPTAGAADETAEAADDEPASPLKHQAVAVIGIALIAMGEEVGAEMALRQFQHLVRVKDHVIIE
jgi:26S proteasome regulatory subunit N1